MVFIYARCSDVGQAKELGRKIVKARAAASVAVWPIEAVHSHNNELVETTEAMLLIKTTEPKIADIEAFLMKNLGHTAPMVASFETRRLNKEYKEWLMMAVR